MTQLIGALAMVLGVAISSITVLIRINHLERRLTALERDRAPGGGAP